ncbi:AAEL006344-PB [Aedes aegypti]|uniref:AAEL006344-PB n=2 Tax=Aedes aegypti TaxID=7159 RepID=A0A1S4FD79_AEDAE|nr:sulfotransferase family cytosolic 1B member 1 [Aedes aegypti]EAT42076.1 AAEL006344-PB [Aedes aegypti]
MFRYNYLNHDEVKRFETPYSENFMEVHLEDTSVNPTGNSSWKPIHCIMPSKYRLYADRIRNLTVYEDDVWVVTFPKAGTTWTQEMVWLTVNLNERSVFLEVCAFISNIEKPDTIGKVERLPRPRHIKSHLPLALLPKQLWTVKPKIIYTARNPKDVTTSFMHHYRHLQGFNGSQKDFLDGILADKIMYCPQIKHATEFWALSHRDHILILHYEDMKRNLPEVIQKVCHFFGKSYTKEQLTDLEKHLMFDTMKANNAANNVALVAEVQSGMGISTDFKFMRKGQIGAYKEELPEEFIVKLDEFIRYQLLGTEFKYRE